MKDTCWTERASKLFCFAVYFAGAYVLLKYCLSIVFPPVAAFAVAFGVSSAAKRLSRRTGIPQGFWAFTIVSVCLAVCAFVVIYVCTRLISEMTEIAQSVSADGFESIRPLFSALERIPAFRELAFSSEEYAAEELAPLILRALSAVSGTLGGIVSRMLKATPSALFGGLVTVMCVYYMSMDFDGVCGFLKRILPRGASKRASRFKENALYVAARYLRAYAILFAVTFCELTVGLLILCPRYALVYALGIAALDILPVFGAGFVLIPWGAVCLLTGEIFMGVGLLVLYLTVTVVRQLIEPRIVGGSMGIHPLGALLAMYVGYRAFGIIGMLIAPMAVSVAMEITRKGDKTKKELT